MRHGITSLWLKSLLNGKFHRQVFKVPIELYDIPQAEMIGYTEEAKRADTKMMLLPFEVSHYRTAFTQGQVTGTLIYMKNGDNFEADMDIQDFEKLLNQA